MKTREDVVKEFHEKFKHQIDHNLGDDIVLLQLRLKLIKEEVNELEKDVVQIECLKRLIPLSENEDEKKEHEQKLRSVKVNFLRELADIQYLISGAAVTFGLNLEEAFKRIHESNMSKLGEDGNPIFREDGKVLKGPNFRAPVLDDLID